MYPLEGIRVVECRVAIAGPLAGSYLARLGAEVIKIQSRSTGMIGTGRPPAWAPSGIGPAGGDLTVGRTAFNAEKTSVGLELKSARGRRLLNDVIARADVFLVNFSAPAIASLGIDAAGVRAV